MLDQSTFHFEGMGHDWPPCLVSIDQTYRFM